LTGLVGGRAGFRELVSRLLRWRVGVRWYGVALLTAPFSVSATLLALALLSSKFLPGFLTTPDEASGVVPMSLGMVVALAFLTTS
jgi:uncharacterized protein